MQKKLAKAEAERDAELMDTARAERILAEDDELFKHYADACMEEWAAQGRVCGRCSTSSRSRGIKLPSERGGERGRKEEREKEDARARRDCLESILVTLARSEMGTAIGFL